MKVWLSTCVGVLLLAGIGTVWGDAAYCGSAWCSGAVDNTSAGGNGPNPMGGGQATGEPLGNTTRGWPGSPHPIVDSEHLVMTNLWQESDPMVMTTGRLVFGGTDLSWPHDGTWFSIYRRYESHAGIEYYDPGFGEGSSTNLHMRAMSYAAGSGDVWVMLGMGTRLKFDYDPTEQTYTAPYGWERYSLRWEDYSPPELGKYIVLEDRNGYRFHFDNPEDGNDFGGPLFATRNRYGQGEDYQYTKCPTDDRDLLTQVTLHDDAGPGTRHLTIERDCGHGGLITKIYDDYTGRTINYLYAGTYLTKVTGACASCGAMPEVQYEYGSNNAITAIKDAGASANTLYQISYEGSGGEVEWIADANGGTRYYDIDRDALTAYVRDQVDNTYKYFFRYVSDSVNLLTKKTISMEDGAGDDITYDYEFDERFRLAREIRNNVLTTEMEYTDVNLLYQQLQIDTASNTLQDYHVVYGANQRILTSYDAYSNPTEYRYDANDNKTMVIYPDGATYEYDYDSKGLLVEAIDAASRTTQYAYDSLGFITAEVELEEDEYWFQTDYTVDELGRVLTARTPEGLELRRWYDVGGHVIQRQSGEGVVSTYDYNENGRMTLAVDNAGGATEYTKQYEYDAAGNVITVKDGPSGSELVTTLAYDTKGREISQIAPGGRKSERVYDKLGRVLTAKVGDTTSGTTPASIRAYNNMGRVTSEKDAENNETTFTYDGFNRRVTTTDPLNNYDEYAYDAESRVVQRRHFGASSGTPMSKMTTGYDVRGRITLDREYADPTSATGGDTDPLRRVIYAPDGQISQLITWADASTANTMSYAYDLSGRMTQATDPDGGQTGYAYDDDGRRTKVTDPNGQEATYAYDADNRLITATDDLGHYSVTDYDARGLATEGRRYSSTHALLAKTTQTYDVYGRLITSRAKSNPGGADDDNADYVTIRHYDDVGDVTRVTGASGQDTTYQYDQYGRPVTMAHPDGSYGTSVYDLNSNVITSLGYEIVGANTTSSQVGYEFDAMDRVLRVINQGPDGDFTSTADNLTTSFVYDGAGQQVTITDEGGQVTTYEYDSLGRQVKMTEDVGASPHINRVTNYTYDRASQLASIIAENSVTGDQTTRYSYNGRGLQTVIDYEETNDVSMFYDLAGNMTQRNDGEHLVDYGFDNMNRMTRRNLNGDVSRFDWYQYDALGRLSVAGKNNGQIPVASSAFTYDNLSRLTNESQSIRLGTARDIQYTYDKAGNQVSLQHDYAGLTVAYGYDSRNRCTDIDHYDVYDSEWVQLAEYTWLGNALNKRETTCDYPGATKPKFKTEFARDGLLRVTKAANEHLTGDMGDDAVRHLGAWDYTYDSSSNVVSATHAAWLMGKLQDQRVYAYDTLNRLITTELQDLQDWSLWRTARRTSTYEYDELGNRLSHQYRDAASISYAHDKANRMTQLAGLTQTYDQAGNQTLGYSEDRGASYSYRYDYNNRLTAVYDGATGTTRKAAFEYDAMGRRIEFINDVTNKTVRYYYDGVNEVLETDQNSSKRRAYIHGISYVDERLMMMDLGGPASIAEIPGKWYYYVLDSMYNVRGLVDRAGSLVERYVYDPYGRPLIRECAGRGDLYGADSSLQSIDGSLVDEVVGGTRWDPRADINNDGSINSSDQIAYATKAASWYPASSPTVAEAFSDVGNPYMFQGRPHFALDTSTSAETATLMLNDHRNRFMDPVTGRWFTRDPIGYDGRTLNLYEFVYSRPTRWADPNGQDGYQPGQAVFDPGGNVVELDPVFLDPPAELAGVPEPKKELWREWCKRTAKALKNQREKLYEEIQNLNRNPLKLGEWCHNPQHKYRDDREGHRKYIEELEKEHEETKKRFGKRCRWVQPKPAPVPVPKPETEPGCDSPAPAPAPVPVPAPPSSSGWVKPVVVGTGVVGTGVSMLDKLKKALIIIENGINRAGAAAGTILVVPQDTLDYIERGLPRPAYDPRIPPWVPQEPDYI